MGPPSRRRRLDWCGAVTTHAVVLAALLRGEEQGLSWWLGDAQELARDAHMGDLAVVVNEEER